MCVMDIHVSECSVLYFRQNMKLVLVLTVFSVLNELVSSASTTMGRHFLLAMPGMDKRTSNAVHFYMFTNNLEIFTVHLTSINYNQGEALNEHLHLKKFVHIDYFLPARFYYPTGAGPKWTFRFLSNATFGLMVLMEESVESAASFLAIPVRSWGRTYYAVTLRQMSSIQIIAYNATTVRIQFQILGTSDFVPKVSISFGNFTFRDREVTNVPLNKFESFDISQCDSIKGSFSGTRITSVQRIGVVSGSCSSAFYKPGAVCDQSQKSLDMSAEMLIPQEMFGRSFITPAPTTRVPEASYLVVAVRANTSVTYIDNDRKPKDLILHKAGDVAELTFSSKPRWMEADKAISVHFVQHSACYGDGDRQSSSYDYGDVSLSIVVPTQLFFDKYITRVPPSKVQVDRSLVVILPSNKRKALVMNGQYTWKAIIWETVWGANVFDQGTINISEGVHYIYTADNSMFVCYLYISRLRYSHIHPVGYRTWRINMGCDKTLQLAQPDNVNLDVTVDDCDDEGQNDLDYDVGENNNLQDSRRGSFISGYAQKRFGTLGPWSNWHCAQDCRQTNLIRIRTCTQTDRTKRPVCNGSLIDIGQPEACYFSQLCPGKCPSFTWGDNCTRNCSKCYQPCNKFNGTCAKCKAGYKNALRGCDMECEQFEFGQDCLGNCLKKCDGEDCFDRATGECSTSKVYFIVIFLVALVIPCCAVLCSGKSKPYNEAEDCVYREQSATKLNIVDQ